MAKASTSECLIVIGIDLGDRSSNYCVLRGAEAQPASRGKTPTSSASIEALLSGFPRSRVVMEAGTHSPWASRLASGLGHEVIVANPREVALISASDRKGDRKDAETLARLGRFDVALLRPIRHRSARAQRDLELLRARDALVRTRTILVNHVRGAVKAWGARVSSGSPEAFPHVAREQLPAELQRVFAPMLGAIGEITARIRAYDKRMATLAPKDYPATRLLRQVVGVGPVTSLAFVLTIEDPMRFGRNRQVGAYVGLRPRLDQSGECRRQLGIAKSGDAMLRRLLVQSAHYILGRQGPDTSLRRYGLSLMERGAGNAKKKAIVAVARRLAVLLLRLWKTGEVYEPLYGQATAPAADVATAQAP